MPLPLPQEILVRCHRLFHVLYSLLFALALLWPPRAPAALLSITPVAQQITLVPGAGWDARGTITNLSGVDLLTTDIFLEFSAYPHNVLAPRQRLGAIEFTVGNRTVSDVTELFHVDLSPDAVRGMVYSLDVFAVDVHGNFSEPATYAFLAGAPAGAVPEPPTAPLLAAAAVFALLARRLGRHDLRGG